MRRRSPRSASGPRTRRLGVLAALSVRFDPLARRFRPPGEATIRRVLALPANPPLTQNADHALLDGIGPHPVLTVTKKSREIQSIVLNAMNCDP